MTDEQEPDQRSRQPAPPDPTPADPATSDPTPADPATSDPTPADPATSDPTPPEPAGSAAAWPDIAPSPGDRRSPAEDAGHREPATGDMRREAGGEGHTRRLTRPAEPPPAEAADATARTRPLSRPAGPPDEVTTVLGPPANRPAESPEAAEDATTVPSTPPGAGRESATATPGLTVVTTADDEPTVEAALPVRPPRPDDGGETQRLGPRAGGAGPATDATPNAAAEDSASAGTAAAGAVEAPTGEAVGSGPGGGSSDAVISAGGAVPVTAADAVAVPETGVGRAAAPWRRLSSAGALIWVLLALFGFTLVVQLRSNNTDEGLATARQEDLVRILSDLEARDTRLQTEINTLEQSQRQLTSGVAGRQAALAEADQRADELGLLAGTLPGRGPGLKIIVDPKGQAVKASAILNAVQELRGAGGEVMEVAGADGAAVRIVASTYFVDAEGGGIVVDGTRITGPYTLWVIGAPQTMQTALQIPGGVVASVNSAGGSVTVEVRTMVEVTAVHKATSLQYARPAS